MVVGTEVSGGGGVCGRWLLYVGRSVRSDSIRPRDRRGRVWIGPFWRGVVGACVRCHVCPAVKSETNAVGPSGFVDGIL